MPKTEELSVITVVDKTRNYMGFMDYIASYEITDAEAKKIKEACANLRKELGKAYRRLGV